MKHTVIRMKQGQDRVEIWTACGQKIWKTAAQVRADAETETELCSTCAKARHS